MAARIGAESAHAVCLIAGRGPGYGASIPKKLADVGAGRWRPLSGGRDEVDNGEPEGRREGEKDEQEQTGADTLAGRSRGRDRRLRTPGIRHGLSAARHRPGLNL